MLLTLFQRALKSLKIRTPILLLYSGALAWRTFANNYRLDIMYICLTPSCALLGWSTRFCDSGRKIWGFHNELLLLLTGKRFAQPDFIDAIGGWRGLGTRARVEDSRYQNSQTWTSNLETVAGWERLNAYTKRESRNEDLRPEQQAPLSARALWQTS